MSAYGGTSLVGAEAAWRGLAALADYRGGRPSGSQLAARIAEDATASQSLIAIRNFLHEILVDARDDPGGAPVVADASELITYLQPTLLSGILRAEVDDHRRIELLEAAAARLSIPALLRSAASLAAAYNRPFPMAIRGCLRKLAQRALTLPAAERMEADGMLRSVLRRQFTTWTSPKRTGMTQGFEPVLDKLEKREPGRAVPEADRVVEMAIECDSLGAPVWVALHEVVAEGGVARVIDMVKTAPEHSAAAAAIMKRIGTPAELRSMLRAEPLDGAAVDALLRGMGIAAANVLLEELVESTARLTRRYLMERLARFGAEIQPMVEGRLKDQRWFVQRNMLALLRSARCPADLQVAARFLGNKDARVRREAVLWCLESPATRDETLVSALADTDPAVLRPAMQSARSQLPAAAVPVLARRLLDAGFPPEFRVLAISLLGRSGSILAVDALLHFVQNGKTLLGRPRLAAKSPEMLAALSALVRGWPGERRVLVLLELARKSRDSDIVAAAILPVEEAAA